MVVIQQALLEILPSGLRCSFGWYVEQIETNIFDVLWEMHFVLHTLLLLLLLDFFFIPDSPLPSSSPAGHCLCSHPSSVVVLDIY